MKLTGRIETISQTYKQTLFHSLFLAFPSFPSIFFSTLSFLLSYITTVHYNTKSHLRKTVLKISGSPFRYEVGKIIVWSGEKKKKESIIRRAEWNIWYTGLSTWLQKKNISGKDYEFWTLDFFFWILILFGDKRCWLWRIQMLTCLSSILHFIIFFSSFFSISFS